MFIQILEVIMNLKTLTDDQLHENNLRNAREEREMLTRILHHLRETERRRLFSKYKCGSITEYAMTHMKYSGDQADRRVKAMRLLHDLPEIEEKVTSGALNLTNMALAQRLFQKEKIAGPVDRVRKTEILEQLENKTTREAEKIVFAINPEMKPKRNPLNFHEIEDDELRGMLLHVKGLYAHSHPNLELPDLLKLICKNEIEKKSHSPGAPKVNSQAEIRRQVWARDNHRCRNCKSMHAVQEEHIIPRAKGGLYTLENICLLCRSCNQRSAIEHFGIKKMEKYLREPIRPYGIDGRLH